LRVSCRWTRVYCGSFAASALLLISGCGGSSSSVTTPPPPTAQFDLMQVANGFSAPLDIQQPPDSSGRLFVVEQNGHIQIIQSDGTRASAPFLDVIAHAAFTSGGETGLLGLPFHPLYARNRRFFVNYTHNTGAQLQSVIAEFAASPTNANFADPATENILHTLDQPFTNHNGGGLAFDQAGYEK
jgi:glucose/arabinose dehydrogenase